MPVLLRALLRAVWRVWPRERRSAVEAEAMEAAERGFRKRRSHGPPWAAWLYLLRVVTDVARSGLAQRARRSRARNGAAPHHGAPRRSGAAVRPGTALPGTDAGKAAPGHGLLRDASLALRRLRRAPGFSATVILVLGLGVGANAAVYGALRSLVLAPPPLPDAHELGLVRLRAAQGPDTTLSPWSYPSFRLLREASTEVLRDVAGYALRRGKLTDAGDPVNVGYELVTPGYFRVLSLPPASGRYFTDEEEGVDATPDVVVLSHGLWTRRFGGDPDAVGRTVTLEGSRLRIVGVAPRDFGGLTGDAELWVPVGQSRPNLGTWAMERADVHWLHAVARIPGDRPAGLAETLSRIGTEAGALEAAAGRPGGEPDRVDAVFTPLSEVWSAPSTRQAVGLAGAGAGLLLLIVVTNLSALLLARERRSARTTAVQLALGAGRARVVRQRALESLLLTGAGGAVALVLARAGVGAMAGLWPEYLFRGSAGDVRLVDSGAVVVDGGVMLVGLALACGVGVLATLAPLALGRRADFASALRGRSPGAAGSGFGGRGVVPWLLAGQVALSVVLLVASGLVVGTLRSLQAQQRGFDAEGLLVLRYDIVGRPAMRSPEATRTFHEELRAALETLPGARAVALGSSAPLGGGFITTTLEQVEGGPEMPFGTGPEMGVHVVDHAWLRTVGVALERGRGFTEEESARAGRVVVITRTAAETFFPGADPLGRRLRFRMNSADPLAWWTVVGVAEDVLYRSPVEGMRPEVYLPLGIWAPIGLTAFVRTEGPPERLVPGAREALARVDPGLPFNRVTTGAVLRGEDVAGERALVVVLGLFTALAVLLSAAGLWATVARSVTERRREIGVRTAVGARPGEVRGLFVRRGLVPILGGAAAGLALCLALTGRLEGLLFGVGPRDPRVYGAAVGVLAVVGLLASWLPARAAARVDPVEALRSE